MDNEARLLRALASPAAPARDPAFALAVIQAAERERYQEETARSVLRAAGLAAAAAALVLPVLGWAASHPDGFQSGLLGAAGLMALVGGARLLTARATVLLHR